MVSSFTKINHFSLLSRNRKELTFSVKHDRKLDCNSQEGITVGNVPFDLALKSEQKFRLSPRNGSRWKDVMGCTVYRVWKVFMKTLGGRRDRKILLERN